MFNINYLLIAAAVAVIAIGQVLFKYAAGLIVNDKGLTFFDLVSANRLPITIIILTLSLYMMSTVAWIQALRTVPLSIAFVFNSISFILVPAAGFVLFHEPVPRFFLPAVALIISGIVLMSRG